MRLLYTFFIVILCSQVSAQILYGTVKGENNTLLSGAVIINLSNETGVVANKEGKFKIHSTPWDVLQLSYIGKKTIYYITKYTDSNIALILKDEYAQLNEFVVDGKLIKKVSTKENDNILDFCQAGPNALLVLKSSLRNHQLSIEGVDTIYKVYSLGKMRPKSIYLDVLGNFHLIFKNHVKQIYLDEDIKVIETINSNIFRHYIQSLVCKTDSSVIHYEYSNHNKNYTLTKNKVDTFYQISNQKAANFASLYELSEQSINLIVGNETILKQEKNKFDMYSFYKNILSRKLNVHSYYSNNHIVVFEFAVNQVKVLNLKGEIKKVFKLDKTYKKVQFDKLQNKFYAMYLDNGIVKLDRINLESGFVSDTFVLKGITFPKKVKVINDWLYFINPNKMGFHKLYRMSL